MDEDCAAIHDQKMRNLPCHNIEVDEIWGFIGKKNKNVKTLEQGDGLGDVWTFVALDADSKLIPSFVVGKRVSYYANAFVEDLAGRLANRVQLTSDALAAYAEAVERGFGNEMNYAQIVKT